jgi:Cys-rich four helix bundle protein (predicted Tat secretion target)
MRREPPFATVRRMNRRDLIFTGAAAAVTHTLVNLGCGSTSSRAEQPGGAANSGGDRAAAPPDARAALARATYDCILASEACLSHCITRLGAGDTSLAACARAVRELLPICHGTAELAATASAHLPALAKVCLAACEDCEQECAKHAGHHRECAACLAACKAARQAAAAVAA